MDSLFDTQTPPSTTPRSAALDAAIAALCQDWSDGRNPGAEGFFDRLDPADTEARVELVYHEFCLAENAGLEPDPAAFFARFPDLRPHLVRLLGLHDALDSSLLGGLVAPPADLPEPGDEIGPYRLMRELGKGGLARVFLAEQADLGDRLVVLKIASRPSPEAVLLARARHPHIVEVLRQVSTGDGGLHLIAMPFLGGASLSVVLAARTRSGGRFRRSGRHLLAALDRVAAPEFLATDPASPSRSLLAGSSQPQAAAWIVARLADALEHAGRLGVTHGDLKPANILLAADGRPMLLDFNLAVDWSTRNADLSGVTGGTLAYMAPECLRALSDPKLSRRPRTADRHRSDLYSLGLVLREILTSRPPTLPDAPYSSPRDTASALADARERVDVCHWTSTRGIPAGLRPILARCLASDPADRYPCMAEFSQALDQWRTRRRRPVLAVGAAVVLALVIGASITRHVLVTRLRAQAEAKLSALWDSGDPAIFRPQRFGAWTLDDTAESARRNLDHYAVLGPEDWRARDDVRWLAEPDRLDLEMWLLEQTWRLASAWSERPNSPEDWQRALALLERSPWASSETFEETRRNLRDRLGLPTPLRSTDRPIAQPLRDYAIGLSSESGDMTKSLAAFQAASAAQPETLWPRYRAAVAAARLGKYRFAADLLAQCLDRHPRNPALWTFRAGCLLGTREPGDALSSCNHALEIDPDFLEAYVVRCVVRARLGQTETLEAEVSRLARLSRTRGREFSSGLQLTLAGFAGGRDVPPNVGTEAANIQAILGTQFERAGQTDAALETYDRVLSIDPEHLRARYCRARLLIALRRNQGMNDLASLVDHPRFEEFLRGEESALLTVTYLINARLQMGAVPEARQLARRMLELSLRLRDPGADQSPMVAEARYALARTLAAGASSDLKAVESVASLLDEAGRADARFLEDRFIRDKAFDGVRDVIVARLNLPLRATSIRNVSPQNAVPR